MWLPSPLVARYVFLEYVPGGSIRSMLHEFGVLEEPLVAVYTRQILLGLKHLHDQNIVHRDIKGTVCQVGLRFTN